jgi:hypothetical protein
MKQMLKAIAIPGLALAALLAAPAAGLVAPAQAACAPGDRIDGTTAEWAREKAAAAGYSDITMERKGCDNFWHGFAMKDGQQTRIVVSPDGEVRPEGD